MKGPLKQLYWVWADMLSRCRNENHSAYVNYGGRGIFVCERWLTFSNFMADVAPRPDGMLLDRVDNDGPYSPENFRWATRTEQNSNRRNCIYVDSGGETVTLKEACRRLGMAYRPVVKRIQDRHWPVEMALSVPVGTGKHFHRVPARAA